MPSPTPATAPQTASSMLSVRTCVSRRVRLAPIAVRMAISPSRAVIRTSRILATFTQASSSTTMARERKSPETTTMRLFGNGTGWESRSEITCTLMPFSAAGYSLASRETMRLIELCA